MYLVIVSINSSILIGLEIWSFMPEFEEYVFINMTYRDVKMHKK